MRTHFFKDLPCGNHFRNIPFIRANDPHDDGELNRLCSIIYAPDERTGLPSSDLAVMLTDKVNPQIKDWIQKQLMSPISVDEPNPLHYMQSNCVFPFKHIRILDLLD